MCCSTDSCIHWLLLARVLTGDRTHHLSVWGRRSNQVRYRARALPLPFARSGKLPAMISPHSASGLSVSFLSGNLLRRMLGAVLGAAHPLCRGPAPPPSLQGCVPGGVLSAGFVTVLSSALTVL